MFNYVIISQKESEKIISNDGNQHSLENALNFYKKSPTRPITIFAYNEIGVTEINEYKLYSKYHDLYNLLSQGKRIQVKSLSKNMNSGSIAQVFESLNLKRGFDLSINTKVISISTAPKLMTYEESGYCFMVPIPRSSKKTWIFLRV